MISSRSSRKLNIGFVNLGFAVVALMLITASIYAQVAGATLSGTITDSSSGTGQILPRQEIPIAVMDSIT
jgi:hypothetical protein